MAPKRKIDIGVEEQSARDRKKLKINAARIIPVQSMAGGSSLGNATPGPSNVVATNSLKGLPSAIDVEKFAEARAFEIDAMQNAIKTASASSTQRAWQSLPRHLRRRAASHDVRRVPARLREKARAEMDPIRKKALGRSMPKRGKNHGVSRADAFLRRQRDKTWLETHIWHAKRMKMENMWGYRLAVQPTEKAYRPSHRASMHGSIIHDASYHSLFELKGPEIILKRILELICDPQGPGPGSQRYITGSRTLNTHIYQLGSYPFDLIGPATIFWRSLAIPLPTALTTAQAESNLKSQKQNDKRHLGVSAQQTDLKAIRTLWIYLHPAISQEVMSILRTATSNVLAGAKTKEASDADGERINVEIADLTSQVNFFEIVGPKANQVIKGALSPIFQDKREEFLRFWSSLGDLQTSGQMPRDMIIGLKVYDPRLKFPPKNAKQTVPKEGQTPSTVATFPSAALAASDIWEQAIRVNLAKPRFKKKDLDERRSKHLIPGTPLNPLRQDARVPILLIQRTLEGASVNSDSQSIHGWSLVIPAGWSMAFFNSLTFTGTRVGGQRERQTQAFEAGTLYFPRDYPSTLAYDLHATKRELEDKAIWDRKPPAKRVSYEKLGTKNPWKADWRGVLGLPPLPSSYEETEVEGLVTTQREELSTMVIDEPKEDIRPWLLRGSNVANIFSRISAFLNSGAELLSEINQIRSKRSQDPLKLDIKASNLIKGALVCVKVKICKRGAPGDIAMIYSMDDAEMRKWDRILMKEIKLAMEEESAEELELGGAIPDQKSIIGFVTTGHFSLSRGEGFAIGAVSVTQLLELQQQTLRVYPNRSLSSKILSVKVKVRNVDGHLCRPAALEILPD